MPASIAATIRRVVASVDVRVGLREVRDRAVERVARPEIRGDRDRVAGAGVRTGERPAAQAAVEAEARPAGGSSCRPSPSCPTAGGSRSRGRRARVSSRGRCRTMPASAAGRRPRAGRDSGARSPRVRLEHRRGRLLGLEDQRIVLVASLEEDDEAACPDAADADDLQGEVDEPVALEEGAAALGHRGAVVGEGPIERRPRRPRPRRA